MKWCTQQKSSPSDLCSSILYDETTFYNQFNRNLWSLETKSLLLSKEG